MALLLALVVGEVTFRDCPPVTLDVGLVRVLASAPPDAKVEVEVVCISDTRAIVTASSSSGRRRRIVSLPKGTPTLRARALASIVRIMVRPRAMVLPGHRAALPVNSPTLPPEPETLPVVVAPLLPENSAVSHLLLPDAPSPALPAHTLVETTPFQRKGRLNPVELAIVPTLGLNQIVGWPVTNYVALGLLGVQSSVLKGVSIAPMSIVAGTGAGLQVSALASQSDAIFSGVQLSSGANVARGGLRGLQFAPFNFSWDTAGVQVGLINVGGDVNGLQLGLINFAGKVTGVQLGLVNVARSSAYSVGALSFIGDAPVRVSLEFLSNAAVTIALKTGGRRMYAKLSLGWTPVQTLRVGAGLGMRFGTPLGWYFEPELEVQSVWDLRRPESFTKQGALIGRGNLGYQLRPRLGVFVSAGMQVMFLPPDQSPDSYSLLIFPAAVGVSVGPELGIGVQF